MIQIESTKDYPVKEMAILRLLEKRFSKKLFVKTFNYLSRPSAVFSNTKLTKLDLIICTHIDVVPGKKELFKLKIAGDKLYGRGTYDMKSAALACLLALERSTSKLKVAIFVTTDEEIDGLSTKLLLEKNGFSADLAIIPDGGSINKIVNSQKGFLQLKLIFNGKSSHASEPWDGNNSAEIAITCLNKIQRDFINPKNTNDWKTSLSLTKITSGESLNQIPDSAELYFDIRFIESDSIETIVKKIQKNCPKNTKLEIIASNAPLRATYEPQLIKRLVKIISSTTGKKVTFTKEASTSDAVFFSARDIPAILFRPNGANMHRDDEFVSKKSIEQFYEIVYKFINNHDT